MKAYHWIGTVVIILLAYYAGSQGWLGKAKDAVTGAAGGGD